MRVFRCHLFFCEILARKGTDSVGSGIQNRGRGPGGWGVCVCVCVFAFPCGTRGRRKQKDHHPSQNLTFRSGRPGQRGGGGVERSVRRAGHVLREWLNRLFIFALTDGDPGTQSKEPRRQESFGQLRCPSSPIRESFLLLGGPPCKLMPIKRQGPMSDGLMDHCGQRSSKRSMSKASKVMATKYESPYF